MRELREEQNVSEAVDTALLKWPRAEEAWQAITWAISRDPTHGVALNESGDLRSIVWDGAKSIGMPDIFVIYRLENPTVTILDVQFQEAKHGQAGRA